jgi:hypothetical protein
MTSLTEEQIWEVIDGVASSETLIQHEKLLKEDSAYKKHFEQFASLQEQLLSLDLEVPSMRFTQNVLDNVLPLTQGAYKKDRAPFLFLVAMGFLLLTTMFFIFSGSGSMGSNFVVNTEGFVSFLSNPFVFNIFILLNIVLAFVILDKKVFKPYFSSKMK